jgi:hypothetical protein
MKRNLKKLTLRRETVGSLRESVLTEALGGRLGPTAIDCSVTCLGVNDQTSHNC